MHAIITDMRADRRMCRDTYTWRWHHEWASQDTGKNGMVSFHMHKICGL